MKKVLYFKSIFTFLITLLCHVGFGQETFKLVTNTSELVTGDEVIILGKNNNAHYYMGVQNNNNRGANLISDTNISGNEITLIGAQTFKIGKSGNIFTFNDNVNEKGFLYAASSRSNHLKSQLVNDINGEWSINISDTSEANIIAQSSSNRNVMQFNYNNGGTPLFSCYASASQKPVYLYKKETLPQTAPILTTPQTVTGTYGVLITPYTVQNTGGSAASWTIEDFPEGIIFENGVFSGTPTSRTPIFTTVTATNSIGSSTAIINFNIAKAEQIYPTYENLTKRINDPNVTLPTKTKHSTNTTLEANNIAYSSSDLSVIEIVNDYDLKFVGEGTATITATSTNTNPNYNNLDEVKTFDVNVTLPPINTATIPHAENFNNNLGVWKNYKISGLNDFYGWYKSSSDNGATVDGDYSDNIPAKSYLISPKFVSVQLLPISIGFNYKSNKGNKKIKILYSTNYNGYGNPDNSTWNLIEDIENNSLINQNILKVIELCNLPSEFHIAFLYEEAIPETRWSISDLEIKYHLSKPNSLEADIINDNSFKANWDSGCNINQYELDVYTKAGEDITILEENFDWANGIGGNDGSWSGNIATSNIGSNLNIWQVENGNAANKSIKLGTSSKKGILKTPVLNGLNGNETLTFRAGAWDGSSEQKELVLKIEGGGDLSQSSVEMIKGEFTSYSVNITNGTPTTRISFEGKNASNSRFFIDDVKIFKSSTKEHIIGSPFLVDQANSKEITGVNLEENTYYYVVRSVEGDLKSEDSNEIKVYNRTTWDGNRWDNEEPNENIHAVVKGDLIIGQGSDINNLTARSLKLYDSHAILVESGSFIKLKDHLINLSQDPIEFEEGAYLIQDNDVTNSGKTKFYRNATFFRYDSKFWSSPVAGQSISGFMPNPSGIYTYNTANRNWDNTTDTNFLSAKGYIFQAGSDYPFYGNGEQILFDGKFTGVPHNGNYSVPVSYTGLGDNGVGNPYGSPISASAFLNENDHVTRLYFWDEESHYIPGTNPPIYQGQRWSALNQTGHNDGPTELIGVGVGFIARVDGNDDIVFNNSMRTINTVGVDIFNRTSTEKDRFWLSLNLNNNKENQILIGYVEGATNGIDDKYDAKNLSNNNSFILSHSNANAMIIEGRQYPLDVNDQIPLYFRASKLGEYTIKLENKEGVFNSQPIYLIDNELDLSINLNEVTEYTFDSEIGNFLTRFEIRYQPKETLSTTDIDETSDLIVYKNENLNKVTSKEKVVGYKVYDLSGRLIGNEKVNQLKDFTLTTQKKGTYIVKFTLDNGLIINKKVIF